jgi:hypothetical protein
VLFQEKDDPQLFTSTPAPQTIEDAAASRAKRIVEMPPVPQTGFIGVGAHVKPRKSGPTPS